VHIAKPGFYRFSDGVANVIEGRLEEPALKVIVETGSKLTWSGPNTEKVEAQDSEPHPLEQWSRQRSRRINITPLRK
jgi:hypothetical protein